MTYFSFSFFFFFLNENHNSEFHVFVVEIYNHFRIIFVFFTSISDLILLIMQIFVRTLDDRTLTFDVQHDDTVNDVKELVEQREGNK